MPLVNMSQSGSCAILMVASYGDTPFFRQVAENVWRGEKFSAAFWLGNGPLLRLFPTMLLRIVRSTPFVYSGAPGYFTDVKKLGAAFL